jgi:dUTP pyrophosphatase
LSKKETLAENLVSLFFALPPHMAQPETCQVQILNGTKFDLPQYATPGAAAADLRAHFGIPHILEPGGYMTVPTGLSLAIPPGYVGKICSRSGLAATRGIAVLNAPGLVDSDYRGEVRVVLINHGKEPFEIKPGDRIAQITFERAARAEFSPVTQLDQRETARGTGGFGSTGVSDIAASTTAPNQPTVPEHQRLFWVKAFDDYREGPSLGIRTLDDSDSEHEEEKQAKNTCSAKKRRLLRQRLENENYQEITLHSQANQYRVYLLVLDCGPAPTVQFLKQFDNANDATNFAYQQFELETGMTPFRGSDETTSAGHPGGKRDASVLPKEKKRPRLAWNKKLTQRGDPAFLLIINGRGDVTAHSLAYDSVW